jgi:hypothetical protein
MRAMAIEKLVVSSVVVLHPQTCNQHLVPELEHPTTRCHQVNHSMNNSQLSKNTIKRSTSSAGQGKNNPLIPLRPAQARWRRLDIILSGGGVVKQGVVFFIRRGHFVLMFG